MQAEDYADMAVQTLNKFERGKFTDNISEYQNTVALKVLIPGDMVKLDSGDQLRFQVMVDHNNSAEWVDLGYTVTPNIPSLSTFGRVPWRRIRWDYAWEHSLVAMNRSPSKIVDFLQMQRVGGMASGIIQFEKRMWRVPSSTETKFPYGYPYYIVKSATAFTPGAGGNYGFTGNLPSDHTTVAEIDPAAYPRWKNYAEPYTAVTPDDLIRKMLRAMYYTNFKPIVKGISQHADESPKFSLYTNYSVHAALKEQLKTQNDNLGFNLDPVGDKGALGRASIEPVRELDNDTTNPVYGINHSTFKYIGLKDRWMVEDKFAKLPTQPTMGYCNVHCEGNLVCYDRRKNWVLSTGTTELA